MQNLSGGSSGSFLFETTDKKYILKTISDQEKNLMIEILPAYFKRFSECAETFLVKIIGLFTIFPENLNVLLMENIMLDRENLVIFDLKGSLADRNVYIDFFPIAGKVLKDQNFLESKIKIKCCNTGIIERLIEDFEVLSKYSIMDYSLIIGIPIDKVRNSEEIIMSNDIKIGIIDILQKYNLKKMYEKSLKSIIHNPKEISSVEPAAYLHRIKEFLSEIFI